MTNVKFALKFSAGGKKESLYFPSRGKITLLMSKVVVGGCSKKMWLM